VNEQLNDELDDTRTNSVDRRSFLIGLGIGAVGITAGSSMAPSESFCSETAPTAKGVKVHHEWDSLKEVVVGYPFFKIGKSIPRQTLNDLPTGTYEWAMELCRRHHGKTLTDAEPKLQEQIVRQIDGAISILRKHGVKVHQVKPWEPEEESYLSHLIDGGVLMFPRDPMVVIGDVFIETATLLPPRRKERFPIRRTLGERLDSVKVLSMPEPLPIWNNEKEKAPAGNQPFLEGGDTFVMGRDIYVGNSGNASSTLGIQWLQKALGPEYRVHEVPLSRGFLHLDCALATPRRGLALVCREAFVQGLPEFLRDWEIIDVSYEDAKERLGCNGLILDDKTILIAEELPHLADGLTKAGQTVMTTPFSAVYKFGGAFRCWHHPLIRDSQ